MKLTRSKSEIVEYSIGRVAFRKEISMSHTTYNNHYWYTYSVDGEELLHGTFNANNWDEAEQIAVKEITEKLSGRADRWNRLLNDFNKEVNVI